MITNVWLAQCGFRLPEDFFVACDRAVEELENPQSALEAILLTALTQACYLTRMEWGLVFHGYTAQGKTEERDEEVSIVNAAITAALRNYRPCKKKEMERCDRLLFYSQQFDRWFKEAQLPVNYWPAQKGMEVLLTYLAAAEYSLSIYNKIVPYSEKMGLGIKFDPYPDMTGLSLVSYSAHMKMVYDISCRMISEGLIEVEEEPVAGFWAEESPEENPGHHTNQITNAQTLTMSLEEWLRPEGWRMSRNGNPLRDVSGMMVVVFPTSRKEGHYMYGIDGVWGPAFPSMEAAMTGAYGRLNRASRIRLNDFDDG